MKAKRILATFCIGLSLLLCAGFVALLQTQSANATIATGQLALGHTQVNVGTAAVRLSSTSVPCYNMILTVSGGSTATGVLVGASSTDCTAPFPQNSTSGTSGTQMYQLPQVTNVNQLWFKVSSGSIAVDTLYTK